MPDEQTRVADPDTDWICVECGAVAWDYTQDDGVPPGWATNVDDEAFCLACLTRNPLDAAECDNGCPGCTCCTGRL